LLPNGDYRNAENVAISRSEGGDVGALENILGTLQVADFGLSSNCNMEIIGKLMDPIGNRMFVFMTDFTDNSLDNLTNKAYRLTNNSTELGLVSCYIGVFNVDTNDALLIVSGAFLNFSTTHPITGVNLLEDLLFWTDNRNQPRKINVTTAIAQPNYYTTEDHISVAKLYPWEVISFLNKPDNVFSGGNEYSSLMKDVVSTSLPGWPKVTSTSNLNGGLAYKASTTLYNIPTSGGTGTGLTVDGVTDGSGTFTSISINRPGSGYTNLDQLTIEAEFAVGGAVQSAEVIPGEEGTGYTSASAQYIVGGNGFGAKITYGNLNGTLEPGSILIDTIGENYKIGDRCQVMQTGSDFKGFVEITGLTTTATPATFKVTVTDSPNPDYDANYKGDDEFLKDKFVRFSYRFKFDDGEYSLIAPFTQIAFVPTQDGYFISPDEDVAYKSTDLRLMVNKVNQIEMRIPSPLPIFFDQGEFGSGHSERAKWSSVFDLFKITEIDILYKSVDDSTIKVLETIERPTFQSVSTSYLPYKYQGNKPYKVIPSKELVRVSDITPLRALSQEVVGNRVIYGSYLDKGTEPESIAYNANIVNKTSQLVRGGNGLPYWNTDYRKEYQNHTLKQNRTYQVGLVLCDRYGRQSNTILSTYDKLLTGEGGSTVYNPYKDSSFSAYSWPGDSLEVDFNQTIPTDINNINYPGLFYLETSKYHNATGWYSMKVVVKQNQQEYYNTFLPGLLRGIPDPNASSSSAGDPYLYSVLQSDNINKIPRSLQEVGPEQKIFSTAQPSSIKKDLAYIKNYITDAKLEGVTLKSLDEDSLQDLKVIKVLKERDRLETRLRLKEENKDNSAVEMFLRVSNNSRSGTYPNRSIQYFPQGTNGTLSNSDAVILIGKGTDLGLYEINSSSTNLNEEITLPALASQNFLDVTSSPLIMKIESNTINNNPGVINQSMVPELAIYETTPVDSLLDIYWETSCSYPISTLNSFINNALSIPSKFQNVANTNYPGFVKNEGSSIGGSAMGDFQVVDQNGFAMAVSSVELDSVIDQQMNNVTSDWTLTGTNPTLNLETSKFLYCDPNNRSFLFTFKVTGTGGEINYLRVWDTVPNLPAIINSPTNGQNFNIGLGGGLVTTGDGVNGCASPIDKTRDLHWRISAQIDNSGRKVEYFSVFDGDTQGTCNINSVALTSSEASEGPFLVTLELKDRPYNTPFWPYDYQSQIQISITAS